MLSLNSEDNFSRYAIYVQLTRKKRITKRKLLNYGSCAMVIAGHVSVPCHVSRIGVEIVPQMTDAHLQNWNKTENRIGWVNPCEITGHVLNGIA